MASAAVQVRYISPEEYLRMERASESRHEYYNGEMYAMAGAGRNHRLIVSNLVGSFLGQLRGRPCETYANDARVKVSKTGAYTYPHVVVVCDPEFEDDATDTVLNPVVIVEVLSPSTESHDRGAKFEHFKKLPSLAHYLLVAQDRVHIEHFVRDDESWILTHFDDLEATITLAAVGCELKVAEIYERIDVNAL